MEVVSRESRKTSSAVFRKSREHDYEFDVNDISRASTPTSTFSSKSEGRKREREHRYSVDDYKRKIARLKSELDMEKAKSRKAHKEKSSELREMRESYEMSKQKQIDELEYKLKKRLDKDKKHLEESLRSTIAEEKDRELQEVLKYKEDEVKELRSKYRREKESAIKLAVDNEKVVIAEKEKQMQDELEQMKKEKDRLEEDYKKKCAEESRKEKEFTKIKEEYDSELRRILGESKKVALENLEKLKKAEKAMAENYGDSDDELNFSDLVADLQGTQSQASSRAVSRSVSTTSELKFDEINANINNLLASPSITPAVTPGPVSQGLPSPLTVIKELQEVSKDRSSSVLSEPASDIFSRRQDEKDRHLQRRVSELQTQTQRLERKIALLKTENETLKRKQDDKKPLEEKVKILKKRNAELAAIARRLEEKAKTLQKENLQKTREMSQQNHQPGSTDQMKKLFARQRAKDLAEHAKNMLAKDREIEELRKKCSELADQLGNSDFLGTENVELYEEKEELISIIKLAAQERLELERQLAVAKPTPEAKLVAAEKYKELEETNDLLTKEISKLERAVSDTERLEIELTQKTLECERLSRDIHAEKSKSKALESELSVVVTRNTELTSEVSTLQDRLGDLDKVNEECSSLRLNLSDAQHECEVAKGEVSLLQLKVQSLETVVKNLEFSTEKLKQVEKDYHDAVSKLQEKQREIDHLQKVQEGAREKYEAAIEALQQKIHNLEAQCQSQALKQQQLDNELEQLRSQANNKSHDQRSAEIQTGKSIEFAPSSTSSPNQSPRNSPASQNSRRSPAVANLPAASKTPTGKRTSPITHTPVIKGHNSNKIKTPTQEEIPEVKKVNSVLEHTESTKSGTDTGFAEEDEVTNSRSNSPEPDKADFDDPELFEIAKKLKELEAQSDSEESVQSDKGDSGMESRGDHRVDREPSEVSITDSRLSALMKKGPIKVYIAKYSYDPYSNSPNENPEVELELRSGDYVLIYGDMDEDGFYDGELIDGSRGLVPSNFLEKVADEDLPDFHAALAMVGERHHDEDSTAANSVQIDLDLDGAEDTEKQPSDSVSISQPLVVDPSSDLEDIAEENEELLNTKTSVLQHNIYTGAPFPRNLQLDRQLANSILVSWQPPEAVNSAEIRSYHVFLDGDFKTAIRGSERTKALLENVESRKIHRVSVRCITSHGQSHDNQCTILVGKDVTRAPFDLRVTEVTSNSAVVSWTPGDSGLHHEIYVNNVEVRVVKPGVYSHTLTGLSPATSHKVKIQAKNLHAKREDNNVRPEKLASHVEFTTAAGGVPDPPVNVQVEAGPQEGSILVTWFPVTIDTAGFSNGALVTGYVVYADGEKVKGAPGATNDHVILTCNDFEGFIPKELHVRTITKEKMESVDSEKVRLPQNLIKEMTSSSVKTVASDVRKTRKSPLRGLDSDEELESAFKEITKQPPSLAYQEPFYSSSCSELSDIPEVEEVSSPESTNENKHLKDTLHSLVNGLSGLSNESSDFEEIYQRNLTEEVKSEKAARHDGKTAWAENQSGGIKAGSSPKRGAKTSGEPVKVPQIEITSEKCDIEESRPSERDILKSDSAESLKSPTHSHPSRPDTHSNKYSASMDDRDGFRDRDGHVTHSRQNSDSTAYRNASDSAKNKGASPGRDRHSRSPRGSPHSGSPINEKDLSGHRHSRSISPSSRQSPRAKASPRSHSSPRDLNTNSRHHGSPAGRGLDERDSPASNRDGKHSAKSSHTSPNTKSNSGYNESSVRDPPEQPATLRASNDGNYVESDDDSITGEINPPLDDNRIRLFVALFDYDPEVMSPNVDSLEEELPFREGQIIKVYGDKDADGFYRGECAGRMGYIPCNMVSEIQVDDPELEEQLMKEAQVNGGVAQTAQLQASDKYLKPISTNGIHLSPNEVPVVTMDMPVRRMVAMYDYDPQELSPNVDAEVELSFRSGDFIITYGEMDDDGFYMGELNGRRGLVPSNFLQETGASDDEALDSISVVTPARSGESINTSDSRKSEQSEKISDKPTQNKQRQNNHYHHHQQQQQQQQQQPQQQQQQQHQEESRQQGLAGSPRQISSSTEQLEAENHDIGMSRPRSMTPDELKQKKKSGGILSKGKNIFKKLAR